MTEANYFQTESRSTRYLGITTFIWLVTTAILAFGPKYIWSYNVLVTFFGIALNIVAGLWMLKANVQLLKAMDELHRKIFLEAAAITLGIVMIFGVSYELISYAGEFFAFEAKISHIYFVMGITFIVTTFFARRRYL